jgi:hypothetical protein
LLFRPFPDKGSQGERAPLSRKPNAIGLSVYAGPSVAAPSAFFRRRHDIGAILLWNRTRMGRKNQAESESTDENGL